MNSVLITGGNGSYGKQFVASLFERYPEIKRVVVFSRDALKQFQMSQSYHSNRYPAIRFFIGDIRDQAWIRRALEGIMAHWAQGLTTAFMEGLTACSRLWSAMPAGIGRVHDHHVLLRRRETHPTVLLTH